MPELADEVRAFICDEGPGDHGHTDCWHLSMAADIIDARIDYDARTNTMAFGRNMTDVQRDLGRWVDQSIRDETESDE